MQINFGMLDSGTPVPHIYFTFIPFLTNIDCITYSVDETGIRNIVFPFIFISTNTLFPDVTVLIYKFIYPSEGVVYTVLYVNV